MNRGVVVDRGLAHHGRQQSVFGVRRLDAALISAGLDRPMFENETGNVVGRHREEKRRQAAALQTKARIVPTYDDEHDRARRTRNGVSLILVLGLLSLVTVLAAVIARSVRTGRTVSREGADRVRAEQLLQTALTRAIEDVDAGMQGYTYPCWEGRSPTNAADAMASIGTAPCAGIFTGDVTNIVPRALWNDANAAASQCGWTNIVAPDGSLQGRISYLVINASGLVDANTLGATNAWSDQLCENLMEDISEPSSFRTDLALHRRYESVRELAALDLFLVQPHPNLFVASFPLNPDVCFTSTNGLGSPTVVLTNKFRINDFTDFAISGNYMDNGEFMTNYFAAVTGVFALAGYATNEAECLAWNLVNDLDTNRIPQGPPYAWREPVVEAVPLINEIVLRQVESVPDPCYEVVVELWYPFYRPDHTNDTEEFALQVGVFSNTTASVDESSVMTFANQAWSFTSSIPSMRYGTETEFVCVTSPATSQIKFLADTNVPPTYCPLGESNSVQLLVRVLLGGQIVDEAMGGDYPADLRPREYTQPFTNAVKNPLQNGRVSVWEEATNATLGAMNLNCDPWGGGLGIPIVHRDGPMLRTGDLGYLPIPDSSGEWRDVDLTSTNGAALADWMTARTTNDSFRGLVCISTRQEEVLRALFRNAEIGVAGTTNHHAMGEAEVADLADLILAANEGGFWSTSHFLNMLGSTGYASWALYGHTSDNVKEDAIRNILDWLTFRQNVFIVVAGAQVTATNGAGVLAEQRAAAIVCRDAFTGACRLRSFRRLSN